MVLFKVALKNLFGTGTRFWLNVLVISVSIIVILWAKGTYAGLTYKIVNSMLRTEAGGGHIISAGFDSLDTLTYENSIKSIPPTMQKLIQQKKASAVLFCNCTIYVKGRVIQGVFKGIDPEQEILTLPTEKLGSSLANGNIPLLLGVRMAKKLKCKKGDIITIKWRDSRGSFDALDFSVVELMNTENPRVDENSIWLSISHLQKMFALEGKLSYLLLKSEKDLKIAEKLQSGYWISRDKTKLTKWIMDLIRADEQNIRVIYALLLFLCSVGIFNAQVVAVFKRRQEIGTMMALGLRKKQIVWLFTLEGIITTSVASIMVFPLGFPLFYWSAVTGFSSSYAEGMGFPLPERILAVYNVETVIFTLLFISILMGLVAWFPARKISRMEPAQALSGRE
ncbi:ABC transporter permease [Candidatus Riflebacteria bacterium]